MFHRPLIALTCFPAALLATATAARADAVVLQASGPSASSYAQGSVLRDTEQLSLVGGDTVRLLVAGQTVILQGPYKGPPRASAASAAAAGESEPMWDGMLRPKPRTRSAAVRGYVPPATTPTPQN